MTLIEEIEEAAKQFGTLKASTDAMHDAYGLVDMNSWWPRIRAALEAAQEMADRQKFDAWGESAEWEEEARFRAAFSPDEGKE